MVAMQTPPGGTLTFTKKRSKASRSSSMRAPPLCHIRTLISSMQMTGKGLKPPDASANALLRLSRRTYASMTSFKSRGSLS